MKKRFYIVFVSRDDDGALRKVPVPMHYAYLFVAAAVIGMFTISGMAGSYSRMLLKTAHFDQVREERDASRKDYAQLEQVAHEEDVQAASLGSLASEISAIYGLRKSSLASVAVPGPAPSKNVAAAAATAPLTGDSLTADSYNQSLDEFLALRTSALNGSAARSIVTGLPVDLSSADGVGVTADLDNAPSLWPVQGPITSSFGEREDPFNGEGAFHKGIDISAAYGTPIRAAADGVVESATMEGGYGRQVLLDHGHDLKTLYAHMSGFTVTQGQSVIRGQVIGYVGSSGRSTGAHLHYEVQIHGTPVNPHKYLRITLADLSSNPAGL
ncbi:MAG TPA: M23 family metallopeptidase [Acidobacteriaceae bacterium]|nr:M23 family metallopeptidase [Acidobacteriaceae bacterium]